jgi:predicted aminopeptidase
MLPLLPLLAACGELDYYVHLARGQGRIILRSRPVHEVLADSTTADDVRAALQRVSEIRRFGQEHVGLTNAPDSYAHYYDTGGDPVAWNVSASPPDRFEPYLWWFPIVGELPYKGFFEAPRAVAERDRLRRDGYDAIHRSVSAYSTLGYLDDPILSTMLDDSEARLADLILHELTHATVFADGHTDYNESAASFVGRAGSLAFLAHRFGPGSAQVTAVRQSRARAAHFTQFVHGLVTRLDSLYQSGQPRDHILRQRQKLFEEGKSEFRRRRDRFGERYDGFLRWELNNARLLSYRRYHSRQDEFEAILGAHGGDLQAAVGVLASCAQQEAPWTCLEGAR